MRTPLAIYDLRLTILDLRLIVILLLFQYFGKIVVTGGFDMAAEQHHRLLNHQ
jgi:hypothetical protein